MCEKRAFVISENVVKHEERLLEMTPIQVLLAIIGRFIHPRQSLLVSQLPTMRAYMLQFLWFIDSLIIINGGVTTHR